MSSLEQVRRHFDRDASRFDAIYDQRKTPLQRLVDSLRSVVVRRFELVRVLAPMPGRWGVLDVGCGTCRYGLSLARLGAEKVVGVDVSHEMLTLAHAEIVRAELDATFELIEADFLGYQPAGCCEVVLAMGYFDYVRDPLPHIQKMRALCSGKLFASFPKRWEWRAPMRRARFFLSRAYVRFYSRREVEGLLDRAKFDRERIHLLDMGRDWILIANCFPVTPSQSARAS